MEAYTTQMFAIHSKSPFHEREEVREDRARMRHWICIYLSGTLQSR